MPEKQNTLQRAVTAVFAERQKFVVLGLTGRTGSGCTSMATILETQNFEDLKLPRPETFTGIDIEKRQYLITHEFLRYNWDSFYIIRTSDIISSFILEKDFKALVSEYSKLNKRDESEVEDKLLNIRDFVELLHKKRIEIREAVNADSNAAWKRQDIYEFNFTQLKEFTSIIKKSLDEISSGSYTKFYQFIANNIRRSGNAYSSVFIPESMFKLQQRVNGFIKQLRHRQKEKNNRVLICLDAIRNPFEVSYFRERYSAFYLVAVSTNEDERRRRLISNLNLNEVTINQIDEKESPSKISEEESYFSQNVQKCVEVADIHIYNPHDSENLCKEMKRQITRYLSLIFHPGIVQPTDTERCMQVAVDAKFNSGCISRQVGAVVTDEWFSVKAIGWNSTPEGQVSCSLRCASNLINGEDAIAFSHYERHDQIFKSKFNLIYQEKIPSHTHKGWPLSYCFKDVKNSADGEKNQVHTRALHAEENAFLQISKYGGQGIRSGYLFTTASPCELCAKKAYQLGVKKIYYMDPYPGIAGTHILQNGVSKPDVEPFVGAIGRGYHQLYDPIMPHKEAMASLLDLKIPNVKNDLKATIKNLEYQNQILRHENSMLKDKGKLKGQENAAGD